MFIGLELKPSQAQGTNVLQGDHIEPRLKIKPPCATCRHKLNPKPYPETLSRPLTLNPKPSRRHTGAMMGVSQRRAGPAGFVECDLGFRVWALGGLTRILEFW